MIDAQEEFRRLVSAGVTRRIAATLATERARNDHRIAGALGGRPRLAREHRSERGYRQHRTDGTTACAACRAAHAARDVSGVAA